jgi:hypothetical protein
MKTGAAGDQKRVARRACLTLLDENAILFSDAFHSLCSAGERKTCFLWKRAFKKIHLRYI